MITYIFNVEDPITSKIANVYMAMYVHVMDETWADLPDMYMHGPEGNSMHIRQITTAHII